MQVVVIVIVAREVGRRVERRMMGRGLRILAASVRSWRW